MSILVIYRTDENDRSGGGSWSLPDERGRFEPIHARHVYIEEDDSEILLQKATQSFATGSGADDVLAQLCQDRLVREKFVGPIVDDQDTDLPFSGGSPVVLEWNRH